MDIHEKRLRFLQQLRTMPIRSVRHLLTLESPDELAALRDACFPQGDEGMRGLIEQEIASQNNGVTGAASPRTVDAVLAEIQASADLAWEHAQQQEAAGNTVRAEWFKGRSVGLGEAAQAIRKANARLDRPETAGKEDCRGD